MGISHGEVAECGILDGDVRVVEALDGGDVEGEVGDGGGG